MSSSSPSPQRSTRAQQRAARHQAMEAQRLAEARRRRAMNATVVAVMLVVFAGVALVALSNRGAATADTSGQAYVADPGAFRLPGLLDDSTVSLQDHLGHPVVVNFFASWCVYCNVELPGFVQVAQASAGQVDFIGVDTSDPGDGAAMAQRFSLAEAGFSLAKDIGASPASDLWSRFGAQGLPVTAFYDAQGQLVDFSGGMLTQDELQQRIKANFGVDVTAPDAGQLSEPVIPLIPRGAYELLGRNAGDPTYLAVDLRSPDAFAQVHVPGAVNIDVTSTRSSDGGPVVLPPAVSQLDKTSHYFLYDQSGEQVDAVANALHDAGFLHVYYVQGGFAAWVSAGMPTAS